jgi:hypothetical protein
MTKINGLNPRKKVTWTIWNLGVNGEIVSWLGTAGEQDTSQICEVGGSEDRAVYLEVPALSPILDDAWANKKFAGIAIVSSQTGRPFLFYVPSDKAALI